MIHAESYQRMCSSASFRGEALNADAGQRFTPAQGAFCSTLILRPSNLMCHKALIVHFGRGAPQSAVPIWTVPQDGDPRRNRDAVTRSATLCRLPLRTPSTRADTTLSDHRGALPCTGETTVPAGQIPPDHVHREFDAYLKCGRLEHGFLRVLCDKRGRPRGCIDTDLSEQPRTGSLAAPGGQLFS